MKILYHPKRILGFEPYVAPEGFDRKAQPVDIYDVFERYYRNHRDAKFIYSVKDAATYTILEHPLTPSDGGITTGTTWRVSYELSGTRYYEEYGSSLLNENIAYGSTVNTITVNDTSGFPDTGTIMIGGSYYSEYYNWKFTYTSKDSTHFYGTNQTIGGRNNVVTGTAVTLRYTWQGTKRYVIVKHSSLTWMKARCEGMGATTPTIEWMYCGNWIASIGTSDGASALSSSCKYIHIHKLSNITRYNYGCHRGTTTLTGKIYLSPSVVYLTPSATDSTAYDIYPGAFTGCSGITEALEIPDQMIVIGGNSFSGTNIPSVTFHNNLVDIRMTAFYGCVSLNGTLTIPDSCLSIGNQAFYNCNKLDILDLGEGVQTIGSGAFQSCVQLSGTLGLPDSLTTIGTLAFYGCTSYNGSLILGSGITSIGQGAFGDDNFTDIDVTANSRYEDVDDVLYEISTRTALHSVKSDTGTITFQTNTLIIGDYCCLRNQRTGTLTVPDSVTRVGIYAFSNCNGFTAITLETATSALVTIGSYSFQAMTGLTGNLVIPNSVTSIGNYAFNGLTSMTGTLTLGTGLTTLPTFVFAYTPFTGTLTIPGNITSIGDQCFRTMNITGLVLNEGLITITQNAFYDCRHLTGTITFPNSLVTIGVNAFYNNILVTGLTFGSGANSVATTAFNLCSGVTNIDLGINGTTVTALVAQKAYFTNLATLTIDASNPTYSMVSGCNILFNKVQTSVSWIPPKATGDLYIPDGVTTIDSLSAITTFSGFFYLGSGLTSITNLYLLSKVFSTLDVSSSNPNYADNADNILYDKTLTQIYYVCKPGSGTLTISGTITYIASGAFNNCTGYTALSLPSGFDLDIYNKWNFTDFTGSSLDASILNCIDGTPADPYKFQISETSLANLLAYNPDAVTDALARYIEVMTSAMVMDGLVMFLDAGDSESYPGSGSTWFDISGLDNDATIYGAVFSTDNGGLFSFNGSTNEVIGLNTASLQITVGTIGAFIKANNGNSGHNGIVAKQSAWGLFVYNNLLCTYSWGNSANRPTTFTVGNDTWYYVTMSFSETTGSPSNNAILYVNGSPVLTTTVKHSNHNVTVQVGEANASQCFGGKIAFVHVHNRVLSSTEINDIFETFRSRYGI